MTKLRIVHLLDDFAIGGVTNGLRLFDHARLAAISASEILAVNPESWTAPLLHADVIIVHFPPRWRGLPFLIALKKRNPHARIIHVEHSYSREWEAMHVPNIKRFRTMMRIAFAQADTVVAVSRAQADWLLESGAVAAAKLTVIYPYSTSQGLREVPPVRYSPEQPLVIGSYGRFCEAKGYARLISAFKALDGDDRFRLVLGGMGPLAADLESQAAGCKQIGFVGQVFDTAAFMRDIHVFAAPSLYESFGQVATEAREAGRPLLTSTAGGLPEQVGAAGLVVDCEQPGGLVTALQALPPMPLAAMGKAGRAAVIPCIERRIAAWESLLAKDGATLSQDVAAPFR